MTVVRAIAAAVGASREASKSTESLLANQTTDAATGAPCCDRATAALKCEALASLDGRTLGRLALGDTVSAMQSLCAAHCGSLIARDFFAPPERDAVWIAEVRGALTRLWNWGTTNNTAPEMTFRLPDEPGIGDCPERTLAVCEVPSVTTAAAAPAVVDPTASAAGAIVDRTLAMISHFSIRETGFWVKLYYDHTTRKRGYLEDVCMEMHFYDSRQQQIAKFQLHFDKWTSVFTTESTGDGDT
eukprot:gene18705-22332_t